MPSLHGQVALTRSGKTWPLLCHIRLDRVRWGGGTQCLRDSACSKALFTLTLLCIREVEAVALQKLLDYKSHHPWSLILLHQAKMFLSNQAFYGLLKVFLGGVVIGFHLTP